MSEGKTSESVGANLKTAAAGPVTAGGLLRQARQAQGLHIAALAAAIKVTPRKLESLESDRFDELPDATFTRGLAQAVCRTLKIDAVPVLALLPPQNGHRLEQVAEGLNTPFRERPGRLVPKDWASISSLLVGVAAIVLVATAIVYWWPANLPPLGKFVGSHAASDASAAAAGVSADAAASDASAGLFPADSASATAGASVTTTAATSAEPAGATESPADSASSAANAALAAEVARGAVPAAAAGAASAVQVSATTVESWVGVTDGRGQSLISRIVKPGESVIVDGVTPFKVTIGNAKGAKLVFRGTPTDLAPYTRDNVARIELK